MAEQVVHVGAEDNGGATRRYDTVEDKQAEPAAAVGAAAEERFDVLDDSGVCTGKRKLRSHVHRDGDWHRSVHVWVINPLTEQLIVQKRAAQKDSWPGRWDVSCAGHLAAGDSSKDAALRELHEELGITPKDVTLVGTYRIQNVGYFNGSKFIDNEFVDVYYTLGRYVLSDLTLQEEEVEEVAWMKLSEVHHRFQDGDPTFVPMDVKAVGYDAAFDGLRSAIKAYKNSG